MSFALAVVMAASSTFAGLPRKYELADLKALERAFTQLAEEVRPSVVAIRTYFVHQSTDNPRPMSVNQGSGFIIDDEGHIATNRHVLEDANAFIVVLDNGQQYEAVVTQTDIRCDLAVLKIDAPDLKPVRWGDYKKVRVNQWTFAVGNPFGLANDSGRMSVAFGAVSALGRSLMDRLPRNSMVSYYGNLIETTSAINPGNSGGPLFNADGEVIGIIAAIETSSGVSEGAGFAIPLNEDTRRILDTLKAGKVMRYGYLGIRPEDIERPRVRRVGDSRDNRGSRIARLSPPNGPAGQAGLKVGDTIIAIDGTPVENSDHLIRLVQFSPVGKSVEVTYIRRGVKRKATVTLGDRHKILGLTESE